jgi:hypothetical protein
MSVVTISTTYCCMKKLSIFYHEVHLVVSYYVYFKRSVICISLHAFYRMIFNRFRKIAKSDYQLRHVCSSFCLSARMEQLGSHWNDLHKIGYERLSKICRENSRFVNIWQKQRVLYMKAYVHLWQYFAKFLKREIFQIKSCRENQSTDFVSNNVFPKIVSFMT